MIRSHHRLFGVLALASLAGTLACGGSDSTAPGQTTDQSAALTQAESQWSAAGVHDYNYDLVSDRFGQHDSVQVQVRVDELTLSKSYLTGQTSTVGQTVPDLFSVLDDAISAGLTVSAVYDAQLGYPARASVNPPTSTPAGGLAWKIVNFARVP
jgi:ABC-type glycerol-3-phosphate transport system substrate-binding protein